MSRTCELAIVTALQEVADTIERELICCDTYTKDDEPRSGHEICYWSGAARATVLAKIAEVKG